MLRGGLHQQLGLMGTLQSPLPAVEGLNGMDGDTGQWYPTKTGFSMPADEVSSIVPLLLEASEAVAPRYVSNTQLELELENDYEY